MPPKKAAEPQYKDLYMFVLEADQEKGTNDDYNGIVSKLMSDKIFGQSGDEICIRRHDDLESLEYMTANWDLLKTFKACCSEPAEKAPDIAECISTACESILAQAENDEYSAFKVLYLGNFESSLVDGAALKELQSKIEEDDIQVTIIFPVDISEMSSLQQENYNLIKTLVGSSKNFFLFTYKQALAKILNIVAKKDKKSMPWKIVFELGPGIEIPVKKLLINRKNTNSFESNYFTERANKEIVWTADDGSTVDEDDVGEAYKYGDCLVSAAEIGNAESETTACLQLLQFVPRENIQPSYLCGDGTDIFFAQDNNPVANTKLDALMKALKNTNRVAVVRKVWRKNARPVMCVLVPDMGRKGLICSDLCYADDISTPYFAPLIKEESMEGEGISEKDDVIDEIIKAKSIKEFDPRKGPVDPAVLIHREACTRKIVNNQSTVEEEEDVKDVKPSKARVHDNIGLFFEQLVLSNALVDRFKNSFPLKVNKETGADRPSGYEIFRKRGRKNEVGEDGTEKKVKIEENSAPQGDEDVEPEQPMQDIDNLLDDL